MNMRNKNDIRIAHVPQGHSARGIEVLDPPEDLGYYEREMQGKTSVVPTATYCPSCSKTKEYNKKTGRLQQKFMIQHSDLAFNISYECDENGDTFAKCQDCNFDLRYETHQIIEKPNTQPQEVYRDIIVDNPKYQNGCYYIPTSQFVEGAKSYQSKGRAKLCLNQRLGNTQTLYRLQDAAFMNISKLRRDNEGFLGISREYWARV